MRSKLEITNNTHWSTRDLRKILSQCAHQEHVAQANVCVVYNRQGHGNSSGTANQGRRSIRLCLPRLSVDRIGLAQVAAVLFGYLKGVKHRDMADDPYYQRIGNWRGLYAWAEKMPLSQVAPLRKQKQRNSDKLEHANKKVAEWTTKAKRVNNTLAKWRRKAAHYENKQRAAHGALTKLKEQTGKSFYMDA